MEKRCYHLAEINFLSTANQAATHGTIGLNHPRVMCAHLGPVCHIEVAQGLPYGECMEPKWPRGTTQDVRNKVKKFIA